MKKLLLTAILGIVLGAGAWRVQHPQGTLEDFQSQASATLTRLKGGVNAGTQAILAQNPATVASQQEQQQLAQSQALDERFANLEKMVLDATADKPTDLTESVSALDTSLEQMEEALEKVQAGNQASGVRLDAIDSRLELLVRRLDEQTVDQDLLSAQEQLKSVDSTLQDIRNDISSQQALVADELATIKERNQSLGLRLDTLSASQLNASPDASAGEDENNAASGDSSIALAALTNGIDERFNALEARLQTVNSDSRRIAALNDELTAARREITELQSQNTQANQAISELNESIDKLNTAGESVSIDTVQAEIRDQLALVQSQFESNAATDNVGALETLLEATRDQISQLEQRVQELPAASTAANTAQETQSALESQIDALERRLENINSADPELASTLSNVQEQVDQLASQEYVTQDDLRAQSETRAVEYKIYFDRNSAQVTEAAAAVLNSFITQEKNRTTGVSIFGFTDRLGSAAYNQQLALQRATNVRSYLIQNGLDYTKIKALNGLGEDAAAAVLPDNSDDAQQRVVVLYAAQP